MRVVQLYVAFVYVAPMLAMQSQPLVDRKKEIQAMGIIELQNNKNYLEWELDHNIIEEIKRDKELQLALIKEELAERRKKKKIESKDDSKKFEQSKMENRE